MRGLKIFLEDLIFKCLFKEVREIRVLSSLSLELFMVGECVSLEMIEFLCNKSATISQLHKPQKDFHGGSVPTPQGATNFPLHWLPHFSSPGTENAECDESEIAMTNANELLLISPRRNGAPLFHSRSQEKEISLAGALSVFTDEPNCS